MATGLFNWSRTPANNANSTYNWAEGMAPSAVNDSARGDKADVAQWRDDISGAIVTGGTSTAYTVTSFSTFTSLALMAGQMIAFTPHATNGATVTLNVDSLGAKPLRSAPSVELLAGTLIQGTPYVALYNASDAAWYLRGFFGNPYNVPLAAGMDFWGPTAPNSSFAFPVGQAISRTTYASLFAIMGTTYGAGDGSTTFNLPDKTGRVSAMKEATATRLTTSGGGVDGATIGAVGGTQNVTLASGQIPSLTSSGSNGISVTSTVNTFAYGFTTGAALTNNGGSWYGAAALTPMGIGGVISNGTNSITVAYTNGSQTATKLVQPTIICNYIIRII